MFFDKRQVRIHFKTYIQRGQTVPTPFYSYHFYISTIFTVAAQLKSLEGLIFLFPQLKLSFSIHHGAIVSKKGQ